MLAENLMLGIFGAIVGIADRRVGQPRRCASMPPYGAFPVRFQTSLDAIWARVRRGPRHRQRPARSAPRRRCSSDASIRSRRSRSGSKSAGRSAVRDSADGAAMRPRAARARRRRPLLRELRRDARDRSRLSQVEGLLLATYDLERHNSPTDEYPRQFARRLARSTPARAVGCSRSALANSMPLDIHGLPMRGFTPRRTRANDAAAGISALSNIVSPGYFKTMGIPIVAGEDFADDVDRRAAAAGRSSTKSSCAATSRLPIRIGRRLKNGDTTYTIVGVVKNSTYDAFGEPPTPAFFFSYRDRAALARARFTCARAWIGNACSHPEVQRAVREIDASLPVYNIRTMAEHVERNLFLRKIPARMFAGDRAAAAGARRDRHLRGHQLHRLPAHHRDRRPHRAGRHRRPRRQADREGRTAWSRRAGLILAWVIAAMVQLHLFSARSRRVDGADRRAGRCCLRWRRSRAGCRREEATTGRSRRRPSELGS